MRLAFVTESGSSGKSHSGRSVCDSNMDGRGVDNIRLDCRLDH